MRPEEIILMAREAGIKFAPAQFSGVLEAEVSEFDVERFAALVAAWARRTPYSVNIAISALEQERARGYREGKAAEREACAQVCDEKAAEIRLYCNPTHVVECAAAIRKRGAP